MEYQSGKYKSAWALLDGSVPEVVKQAMIFTALNTNIVRDQSTKDTVVDLFKTFCDHSSNQLGPLITLTVLNEIRNIGPIADHAKGTDGDKAGTNSPKTAAVAA